PAPPLREFATLEESTWDRAGQPSTGLTALGVNPGAQPMTRRSPEAWPEPFLCAKERLDALLQANGFRFATLEHYPESSGQAFAEYAGRGQRLRLVWEGRAR